MCLDWKIKVGNSKEEKHQFLGIGNEARGQFNNFCQPNDFLIPSAFFKQPKQCLYTWTLLDRAHRNKIDYIISTKR